MSREKQTIDEMTKIIDQAKYDMWVGKAHQSGDFTNHSKNIATALYNEGYCKPREGKWYRSGQDGLECSLCGAENTNLRSKNNFCPNCGAHMTYEG